MPTINPDYKPDWEALHDHHAAERKRILEKQNALMEQDGEFYKQGLQHDAPERIKLSRKQEALQTEFSKHHTQCLRCLDTYQHKTIQDAARWVFRNFDPNMGSYNAYTVHKIDFEKFTTIEQVNRAWSEANKISEQINAEKAGSLPVGEPGGKDIFQETGKNRVGSAWQEFDMKELHPGGYYPRGGHVHTLVTVDQRENEYHICFMQDPDIERGGFYVEGEIAALATAMFNRVQGAHAEKTLPKSLPGAVSKIKGWLSSLVNIASAPDEELPGIHPHQFHFYVHHRPIPLHRERFLVVDMKFENERFGMEDVSFVHYDVIPSVIQKAYKDKTVISNEAKPGVFPQQEKPAQEI